ncbi:ATP-grasp domain-containing protein [Pantoea sp.]|uniref:ATP-grasp domain-containing protein n=1 Tax=Pantoea sp. TaxID=69393 RepID=UPI0031E10D9E
MPYKIWLTEGLSSQRDIINGIKLTAKKHQAEIFTYASHKHQRNEILSLADSAIIEPADNSQRLEFILNTINKYNIQAIHAARHAHWYETHRQQIEASGARLTTGARDVAMLDLADDKVAFAQRMQSLNLPVVPSLRVDTPTQLRELIAAQPFGDLPLCVKPVTGIYGMGFWQFDERVSPMAAFTHPDARRVNAQFYLQALEAAPSMEPLVLMPYLPGPEYSVDMLVENGEVLAAVARRKEGALQYLENSGAAFELAKACASAMGADGLVNVQTRNDASGNPLLLEINLRPSGGIGYTRFSGVNIPGLFALRQLGLINQQQVIDQSRRDFSPATVRAISDVVAYDAVLANQLQ